VVSKGSRLREAIPASVDSRARVARPLGGYDRSVTLVAMTDGGASPFATGGGGVRLEHRYAATLLAALLTGKPIPELGDGVWGGAFGGGIFRRAPLVGPALASSVLVAAFLLPGFSVPVRVLGIAFFGLVVAYGVPFFATMRITVTDRITLRRLNRSKVFDPENAVASWQQMPVGFTKSGWSLTVLNRDRSSPGMRLPLFGFGSDTVDRLGADLACVTERRGQPPPDTAPGAAGP
jgi:hypothetical protein